MGHSPGQRYSSLTPLERLVRVAQVPQCPGPYRQARNSRIYPVDKGQGAVLLEIIQRYPVLTVLVRPRRLAVKNQLPTRSRRAAIMTAGILLSFREREALLVELNRGLHLLLLNII